MIPIRCEGVRIPEGISVTHGFARDRVYLRCGQEIAVITLPNRNWDFELGPNPMYYEVLTREWWE
jgi:hypothetical protein